jgi:hypothetical protein
MARSARAVLIAAPLDRGVSSALENRRGSSLGRSPLQIRLAAAREWYHAYEGENSGHFINSA